jgi:hypothetical protein
MLLDHSTLEPFEPIVDKLFDSAFGGSLKRLTSAGISTEDVWYTPAFFLFRAACLSAFKKTQVLVGNMVLDLERQIAALEKEEATARAKRDSTAETIKSLRLVIQNRQLVLRRLIDTMLWVIVYPNFWVLRRLRVEGGIKRIAPETLEPLLRAIENRNESDETLTIICDLTTTAQLGDLVVAKWIPARGVMKIVVAELKVGSMNILLRERLKRLSDSDMKAEITAISEELGRKASEQAARMVRQETRLNNFERVIQTDQGVDPLSGLPFKMTRGSTVYKDYRDKLATVLARAKSDGWCGLTLDRCLHLIAEASGRTPAERQGVKIAHDFYHLRRGSYCAAGREGGDVEAAEIRNSPKAVDLFDMGMRTSISMPPLLWYPRNLMLDVLAGRIKVYAQFDYELFFDIARETADIKLSFITGKLARRIKADKASGPLIEYRDHRFIRAELGGTRWMLLGARWFGRLYFSLTRPRDLVRMLKDFLDEVKESQAQRASKG